MTAIFENLLRSNFRFGRMYLTRTFDMAGRIRTPLA